MKVKLTEHYQDATIVLQPEQVAEVDDALGAWLVQHRKAYVFVESQVIAEAAPVQEEQPVAEIPVANTQDAPKRSKRSK